MQTTLEDAIRVGMEQLYLRPLSAMSGNMDVQKRRAPTSKPRAKVEESLHAVFKYDESIPQEDRWTR